MKILRLLLIGLLPVSFLAISSCDDDEDPVGIVNFDQPAYSITTDDLTPFDVTFSISPAPAQNTQFVVSITGADAGTVFNTTPATTAGEVTVPVTAGSNTASFEFEPLAAGIGFDSYTLDLAFSSVGPGLTTGITTASQIVITNTLDRGESLPYTEDFSNCAAMGSGVFPPDGWKEYVVEQNAEGSAEWGCTTFPGVGAVINSFVPGATSTQGAEVWLISPRIDLVDATNPTLTFDVDRRFDATAGFPEDAYDILVSTDYNGANEETATWTRFTPGFDAMTANNAGADDFTTAGPLDISAFAGEVMAVAFVYRAGAPGSFDATILRVGNFIVQE